LLFLSIDWYNKKATLLPSEGNLKMSSFPQITNIREIRKKLGLNQNEFWSKIGVTQSGGSRYESGRNMPKPVRELLRLVHIERVDLERVNGKDLSVLRLLKEQEAETYHRLLKQLEKTENP
jgi:transcriptional regulator, XRE family